MRPVVDAAKIKAKRDGEKRRLLAFREAAQRMSLGAGFSVPLHAAVQPCEGGAFVDALVWVPNEAIQGKGEDG